jgi:hypothetical protein
MPLAYKSAIYILNRTFASTATASGANWFVPFTRMSGQRIDISHIRVWGCDVTYRVPTSQRLKADPRGKSGILTGFTANPENYIIIDSGTFATRSTRDIVFHEFDKISAAYDRYLSGQADDPDIVPTIPFTSIPRAPISQEPSPPIFEPPIVPDLLRLRESYEHPSEGGRKPDPTPIEEEAPVSSRLRSRESKSSNSIFLAHVIMDVTNEMPLHFINNVIDEIIPANYDEVLSSVHRAEWLTAINKEYNALLDKGVFGEPCPLPPGRKATGNKLVLKNKTDASGHLSLRKARLTAQGFSQVPGIDYGIQSIYAPVAHLDSCVLRCLRSPRPSLSPDRLCISFPQLRS